MYCSLVNGNKCTAVDGEKKGSGDIPAAGNIHTRVSTYISGEVGPHLQQAHLCGCVSWISVWSHCCSSQGNVGHSHTWGFEPCRLRGEVAVTGAGEQHVATSEQHVAISVLPTTRDLGRTPRLHREGSPADRPWLL